MPQVRLTIRAIPNARMNEVGLGNTPGIYRVRVQAPPDRGKANAAVTKLLASRLGVSKKQVWIERGESSRDKVIVIAGLRETEIHRILGGVWT